MRTQEKWRDDEFEADQEIIIKDNKEGTKEDEAHPDTATMEDEYHIEEEDKLDFMARTIFMDNAFKDFAHKDGCRLDNDFKDERQDLEDDPRFKEADFNPDDQC